MRYLVQFAIPALILMGALILVMARRRPEDRTDSRESGSDGDYRSDAASARSSDAGTVIAMLLIGAAVVIGLAVALPAVIGG